MNLKWQPETQKSTSTHCRAQGLAERWCHLGSHPPRVGAATTRTPCIQSALLHVQQELVALGTRVKYPFHLFVFTHMCFEGMESIYICSHQSLTGLCVLDCVTQLYEWLSNVWSSNMHSFCLSRTASLCEHPLYLSAEIRVQSLRRVYISLW